MKIEHLKIDRFDESVKLSSERPKYSDEHYALNLFQGGNVVGRFPIKTSSETNQSKIDLLNNHKFLPDEIVENATHYIKSACTYFNIGADDISHLPSKDHGNFIPMDRINKTAFDQKMYNNELEQTRNTKTASSNHYILDKYPVNCKEDIKTASEYFENNYGEFSFSDRLKYASELHSLSESFGESLPSLVMKYAEPKLASDYEGLINARLSAYKNRTDDIGTAYELAAMMKNACNQKEPNFEMIHDIISSADAEYGYSEKVASGTPYLSDRLLAEWAEPFVAKYASIDNGTISYLDSVISDDFNIKTASDTMLNLLNDSGIFKTAEFRVLHKIAEAAYYNELAHESFMEDLGKTNPELHKKYNGAWLNEFESGEFSPEEIQELDAIWKPHSERGMEDYIADKHEITESYNKYNESPAIETLKNTLIGAGVGGALLGTLGAITTGVGVGAANLGSKALGKILNKIIKKPGAMKNTSKDLGDQSLKEIGRATKDMARWQGKWFGAGGAVAGGIGGAMHKPEDFDLDKYKELSGEYSPSSQINKAAAKKEVTVG